MPKQQGRGTELAYQRRIRLEYYKVCCKAKDDQANEPDRNFDFTLWIEKARRLSLEARTYDYQQEQARLDRLSYDEPSRLWCMSFVRLRETNIPTRGWIDRETEPLDLDDDEFISEDAAALYDHVQGAIMLQRNRYSLGPAGIEEYINLLWANDNFVIYLRPIAPRDILAKASNAAQYRRMTIRFADLPNTNGEFGTIGSFISSFNKYEAITAEVTVTMGRKKNRTLKPDTVVDSISDVIANKRYISKAELSVKMDEDATVEIVDLFEDKIHKIIWVTLERRESLISEYLFDRMIEEHTEMKPELLASLGGGANGTDVVSR